MANKRKVVNDLFHRKLKLLEFTLEILEKDNRHLRAGLPAFSKSEIFIGMR